MTEQKKNNHLERRIRESEPLGCTVKGFCAQKAKKF